MRGVFIQQNAYQKKIREGKKKEFLEELIKKEKELVSKPGKETTKQAIKMLQTQYLMIINAEVEWKIKIMKQNNFAYANKSGKLLAWQLNKKQTKNSINKLNVEGKIIDILRDIKKHFVKYFTDLY